MTDLNSAPVPEETYTFYHQCFCKWCRKIISTPIQKKASDIASNKRESVLAQIKQGAKLLWPYDPTEEEAAEIAASATCPNDPEHKLEFIWAIGAA